MWFMTDPRRTPHHGADYQPPCRRGWGVIYRHFGAADRLTTASAWLARAAAGRRLVLLIAADPELARAVQLPTAFTGRRRSCAAFGRGNPRWIETASAHSRAAIAPSRTASALTRQSCSPVFESASPSRGQACSVL